MYIYNQCSIEIGLNEKKKKNENLIAPIPLLRPI